MAELVIYRKYRPQKFSEVIGQEHVIKTLTSALITGRIAHAYLFAGPRGVGKTSVARILAKAVNCLDNSSYEPCNKCESCLDIMDGRALDLIEIDAASNRGIDEIRELRERVRFTPSRSKYKVFVIDECLTGDHLITLADGRVKKISEIENGERVASIDLKTGKIISGKVENWFKKKTNKIFKIRTPQTILKCTPTHRLWIFRRDKFLLVEAKDIKFGDFLLSPLSLPHIQKNNLTPAQLSLLALIQCDGHVSKDSITIQIEIQKDREYFTKIAKEGFEAWKLKEKPVIKTTSRGTRLIRIYSKKLKEILSELGCPQGKKTDKIDIPDAVFQAPLKSIQSYIDTCFCCEGDIIPFGPSWNINYRLNFTSGSEIFVKKLQLLLKKFEIGSNSLEIKKKKEKHLTLHRLSLSGYNLRLFCAKIGLTLNRKANNLGKYLKKKEKQDSIPIERIILQKRKEKGIPYSELTPYGIYPALGQHMTRKSVEAFIKLGGMAKSNRFLRYRYEKVKRINTINKSEWVYDFTVGRTHTFIANGICSSNSHQLTKEAFNALLKTLEEPPSHAIFVLATTEPYKMLPTILSRVQRFDFKKLSLPDILKRLEMIIKKEGIKVDEKALRIIALNSEGFMRDAESMLGQVIAFTGGEKIAVEDVENILGIVDINLAIKFVDLLVDKKSKDALVFIDKFVNQGYDLVQFIQSLVNYMRKLLLIRVSKDLSKLIKEELSLEQLNTAAKQSEKFSVGELSKMMEILIETLYKMKRSTFPQIEVELAVVEICGR